MYNIVIVEDEPIELESMNRIISQCVDNVILHEASTGKQAIELIDNLQQIDMMFVDINIPLPNGKEVIEHLRTKNHDTKIVVTTANDDFDILRSMLSLKIEDYLLKPVKKTIITETLKKTLSFNDSDIASSRALKNEIINILNDCDYTRWHKFLFKEINEAYKQQKHGNDLRFNIKDILDILNIHVESLGSKFSKLSNELIHLSQEIDRQGLSQPLYSRLIFSLLSISKDIFDHIFKTSQASMDFIDRAKYHIERNLLNNITLDDIAEHSFVSSCYLSRAFKKNEGIGFSNYITERKIEIARYLLKFSDLKVNTIALELSWQDSNYFCRIFKKETGMAPSDYRQLEISSLH